MPRKADIPKIPMDYLPLHFHSVGEKKNYNLVNFDLYSVGTIEYEPAQDRFHSRVGFENKMSQSTCFSTLTTRISMMPKGPSIL